MCQSLSVGALPSPAACHEATVGHVFHMRRRIHVCHALPSPAVASRMFSSTAKVLNFQGFLCVPFICDQFVVCTCIFYNILPTTQERREAGWRERETERREEERERERDREERERERARERMKEMKR